MGEMNGDVKDGRAEKIDRQWWGTLKWLSAREQRAKSKQYLWLMKSSTKKCLLQTWEIHILTALDLSLPLILCLCVCFDVQTSSTKTFHFNHFYYYYTHIRPHTPKNLNSWHFSSMIASLSLKQKLTVGTKEEKPSSYCLLFLGSFYSLLLFLLEMPKNYFEFICLRRYEFVRPHLLIITVDYGQRTKIILQKAVRLLRCVCLCSFGEFCVDGWKIRPKALATFWICIALPWLCSVLLWSMRLFITRTWDIPKVNFECGNDRTNKRDRDSENGSWKLTWICNTLCKWGEQRQQARDRVRERARCHPTFCFEI